MKTIWYTVRVVMNTVSKIISEVNGKLANAREDYQGLVSEELNFAT